MMIIEFTPGMNEKKIIINNQVF
jgi:hypothetical protein